MNANLSLRTHSPAAATRTIHLVLLGIALTALPTRPAIGQNADTKPAAPDQESTRPLVPPPPAASEAPATPKPPATGPDELRLNFRGVPLDMVLDYLSEAAGFIIIKETEVRGKVDAWSNQPLTRDEAVDLLNTILNKNDYAAIRNGRTLTIVARDEAKKRDIPVKMGNELEKIPKNEEMVTQIIPVRHANVTSLMNNLQPLIGTYATMTVNESANSLLLTATQADVRRMAEIINALDESISSTSAITVFALRYADAKELATVVKELFAPTQTQNNNNNNRNGFTGGPFGQGGFPGAFGQGGAAAGGAGAAAGGGRGATAGGRGGNANSAVNARVVAVADERSNSLVVGAPDDMLAMIKDVVNQIDQPVNDITELRVFKLHNSDPIEISDMLAQLFPDDTKTSGNGNDQAQFRFNRGGFGGFGGAGANRTAAAGTSERMKKKGRVLAVPDQRTDSVIVSAASELMPQIAEMIAQLDSNPARKQKVFVYSLENADVQQVQEILKGMFERTTQQNNRNNTSSRTSVLSDRSTSQSSGVGSSRSTGIGGNNSGFGSGGLGGQNR